MLPCGRHGLTDVLGSAKRIKEPEWLSTVNCLQQAASWRYQEPL